MTTAEWEQKASKIIEDYCNDLSIIDALTPYYANIIREFDDKDGIILRGMVHGAFDYLYNESVHSNNI